MEAKKTVWSIFRDYVNSKPIGTLITRQELLKKIEEHFINRDVQCVGKAFANMPRYSSVTLDCARNMATGRYYLEKTERVGQYKIICHFPSDYTVSQLRKDYDCEQKMMAERNEHGNNCKNQSNE